jgi:hypothetical protein
MDTTSTILRETIPADVPVPDFAVPPSDESRRGQAEYLLRQAKAITSKPTERAFDFGRLLNVIQRDRLYEDLGHPSFERFRKAEKLPKTTVYTSMAIDRRFDRERHLKFGATRLRALAFVPDAEEILENGLTYLDGGEERHIDILKCNSRDFAALLKARKLPERDPLAQELAAATSALLAGAGDEKRATTPKEPAMAPLTSLPTPKETAPLGKTPGEVGLARTIGLSNPPPQKSTSQARQEGSPSAKAS